MSTSLEDEKDYKNFPGGAEHVESLGDSDVGAGGRRGTIIPEDFGTYIADATDAVDQQKEQSVGSALRRYRKGIIYSIIFSS